MKNLYFFLLKMLLRSKLLYVLFSINILYIISTKIINIEYHLIPFILISNMSIILILIMYLNIKFSEHHLFYKLMNINKIDFQKVKNSIFLILVCVQTIIILLI